MNKQQLFCGGLGLGAGLMYVFDPGRGKRRRAMMRDKLARTVKVSNRAFDKTSRDLSNRTGGVLAEISGRLCEETVSDEVLVARVRASLGRAVAHPHAVGVSANDRKVTLTGPVFASEVAGLLKTVWGVRGVNEVENQLEAHEETNNVPELQGAGPHPSGAMLPFMQESWSPTTRLLMGAAGGALAIIGAGQRGAVGVACEVAGLGVLARALINQDVKTMVGTPGGHGIEIHKIVNIQAPVEKVFDFWTHHENFPKFMSHVREVIDRGEGRYHWIVDGPAGLPVEWVGKVIEQIPNQLQRWESVPGSFIAQSGLVRFQPNEHGGTRLDIRLTYNPPAGLIGHAVAALLGADPKSEMDADLVRMKSYIETGHQPRDAAQPVAKASVQGKK